MTVTWQFIHQKSVCLSISLSVHMTRAWSLGQSVHMSMVCQCPCMHPSFHNIVLSVCLSTHVLGFQATMTHPEGLVYQEELKEHYR
jgi:hypothetical protein